MLRVHRAKTPFERCVYPVLKEALPAGKRVRRCAVDHHSVDIWRL